MLPSFSLPALLILHVNLAALIHAKIRFFNVHIITQPTFIPKQRIFFADPCKICFKTLFFFFKITPPYFILTSCHLENDEGEILN